MHFHELKLGKLKSGVQRAARHDDRQWACTAFSCYNIVSKKEEAKDSYVII
jgi:hypothetical protein